MSIFMQGSVKRGFGLISNDGGTTDKKAMHSGFPSIILKLNLKPKSSPYFMFVEPVDFRIVQGRKL